MAILNPLIQNIPIANPQTNEVLQEKLILPTDTPYSTNKTKQPYSELVTYSFDITTEGSYNLTVTADFALTELHCQIYAAGVGSDKTHDLRINGVTIAKLFCPGGTTIQQQFTFPGVIIRKGSILNLTATETGATTVLAFHVFTGYAF